MEDVYEPLGRFRDEFRERHAALTRAKFKELVETSHVDILANRKVVAEVKRLMSQADSTSGKSSFYTFLAVLGFLAAVAGLLWLLYGPHHDQLKAAAVIALTVGIPLGIWMLKLRGKAQNELRNLRSRIAELKDVALRQMEPLNQLFSWEIPVKLIQSTVPRLEFDPYFSARRLEDLRRYYDWSDDFNRGKSVVGTQSGAINGNPFVFVHYLASAWESYTYTGSLDISWLEEETDDEGHVHMVRRYETLTASLDKPKPVINAEKCLIYGNDAAPNLRFSREPSELSNAGDGFLASMQKKRACRRLEKFSRNLEDSSQYTIMGNREFETLFETTDRNHEVEYRLLFTALAQTQMLQLLKDREVGYGDDFEFLKQNKINQINARHLAGSNLNPEPQDFMGWDYDQMAGNFMAINAKFFKDLYFALAPLLAIPLYQQTRPHFDIWKGVIGDNPSSFWEHECMANKHGDQEFRPAGCVTPCLLKTQEIERRDGVSKVTVTAHGYRTEDRLEYVSVLGGDGDYHNVPVPWKEYLPITGTRDIMVTERAQPQDWYQQAYNTSSAAQKFRALFSYCA